jgi:uncharacterized protein with PIN domain
MSIKDFVEHLGVPHAEIDLMLVNDAPVDFSHIVRDGDRITVYPVFETLDISPVTRLRPHPLRETRFVVEGRLGRLARYLRVLGFDALCRSDYTDETLCAVSVRERRIVLSRDRGIVARSQITHGHRVRAPGARDQAVEVVRRFNLQGQIAPFRRCPRCNALLERGRDTQAHRARAEARERSDFFSRCPSCDRQYEEGAYAERMRALIRSIIRAAQ